MRRNKLRILQACAIAAACGLSLTACGGIWRSSSGRGSSNSASGGTITAAVAYEGDNFSPVSASSALVLGANWHVMEGLYELDMTTFEPYKALAKEDEPTKISDTEYEVTLRDDAKYSDGTDVVAQDVVNSFEKNTADGQLYSAMLSFITGMSAKDDKTVSITVEYPTELLKSRLALVKVFPASATEDDLINPIGSGPYKYQSISKEKVVFEKNDLYNGDKPAGADTMEWSVLKDDTARATALQGKEVMVMENVPSAMADLVTNAGATIDKVQGFSLAFLMFNTKKAPFDNAEVRQAVLDAIDIDKLIDNALNGEAEAATSFLPENHPNYHEAKNVYSYDPEKAKELLAKNGVTDLSITLLTTDHPWIKALSPQIKNNLDAIGIKTELKEEASASLYANNTDIDNPSFDIVLAPGDPSVFGNDPDLLMNWWYGDNTWTQKRSQWKGSEGYNKLHTLMSEAAKATGSEQQEKWNECYDLLSEEVPIYPLLHRQMPTAYFADQLDGYQPISTTGLNFIGVKVKQ